MSDRPPEDCSDEPGKPCHWKRDQVNENGWNEWRNLVLRDLKCLDRKLESLRKEQSGILQQLAALKVKSGVWGAMGACIPISLLLLMQWMKG